MSKAKLVAVFITSAVVIDGKIVSPSDKPVDISEKLARNLLHRGKAKLATAESASGDDEKELADHTVKELKAILDEYGVEYDDKANKAALIELVEKAESEAEGE